MFKTFATTVLALSSSMAFAGHTPACCGGCAPPCTAPAACAAAPTAPQAAMPAPQTAAGTRTYQSFSYEPGTAPAPVATGRMMTRGTVQGGGRQDEPWKYGDNKARGRYLWNAR